MIKLKNIDKEKQKLSFITDMPVSLANAIRRSALEIPIMAIDEVEIVKNDSALYDEIIAHRVGLIPIKTEKTSREQKFKLVAGGPGTVYSTDIKPSVETKFKLPIVMLDNEQEIEVICHARLGKGIEHIKYSPGLVYFKHDLDEDVLDFVYVDENGKIICNEDECRALKGELQEKIKKAKEANELIFEIESWGQLDAKDIFPKAVEALEDNLKELSKEVK